MSLRKIVFLLLFISLFSCQHQAENTAQEPHAAEPAVVAEADTTATSASPVALRISPIISGYWLSTQYLKTLERTRSPAKAFDHTPPGPSSIYIEPFANQKDSIKLDVTYGLHEGGDLLMVLRSGGGGNAFPLSSYYGDEKGSRSELTYQLSATDTTLFFIRRDTRTNRVTDKISYRRVVKPGVKTDLNRGVEWGVNKLLLTGHYQGLDSIGQPVNARFLPDGTVTGLPFSKYLIQVDFTGPNPGDELIFDVYSERQHSFGASFGHDTLRLYTIDHAIGVAPGETDTTDLYSRGRLHYQLIRLQ